MEPVPFVLAYALMFNGAFVAIGRLVWGEAFDFGNKDIYIVMFFGIAFAAIESIALGIATAAARRVDGVVRPTEVTLVVQRSSRGGDSIGAVSAKLRIVALSLLATAPLGGGVLG